MSASLLCSRFFCRPHYSRFAAARHAASNAYYVLLPEVPSDTPATNPLMRTDEYPQFSKISPDKVVTGCAKRSIQYDVEIGKHVEQLKDPNFKKDFASVFEPIEKIAVPLNFAWRTSRNLNYVKGGDYRAAFQRTHPQVERAKNERWISETLYNAIKEVRADHANLTEQQLRLVDMYLLEARLNGVELDGDKKKAFVQHLADLVETRDHYRNRVMLSHNMFSDTIDDFSAVVDLPKSLVTQMAVNKNDPTRGPWKVTLNHAIYEPFLEYCSNRMMRWNLWHAYNNRSSIDQDEQNLSNHQMINLIRLGRKDIAVCLGYENFAEMSMETKMAGSVDTVLNMIENFKSKFYPAAQEELESLQEFAIYEGFRETVQLWDLPYWRRRQRDSLYPVDMDEVAQYFPLPKVMEAMFELCSTLFGIVIKDCTQEVDRWHTDVRFFKVFNADGGEFVAAFYVDAYTRPEKMHLEWVDPAIEASSIVGVPPASYMSLHLDLPYGDRPSLLNFRQTATLFSLFGHTLQQIMTTVPYSEIAGQRNIEWDALHTTSSLLRMMLYNKHVLKRVSCHYETGDQLSDTVIDNLLQSKRHMSSYAKTLDVYMSAFDMEMYLSDKTWQDCVKTVWANFMPMPLDRDDNHPCSLTNIFTDQQAASHYSWLWSEMMAADALQAFEQIGFEDVDKLSQVGRRYRDTFLSLGGSVPAGEVFRRFQGRDPSSAALFQYYGLNS